MSLMNDESRKMPKMVVAEEVNSLDEALHTRVAAHHMKSINEYEVINEEGDEQASAGADACEKISVGIIAMAKKVTSKPMEQILDRLKSYAYFEIHIFSESMILHEAIEAWPRCDCVISFFSKGFPLAKAQAYAALYPTFLINDLEKQWDIMDRTKVYQILKEAGIEQPRYAIKMQGDDKTRVVEQEDQLDIDGVVFHKPFVEKPINADDHNVYIYFPTTAGGGSQRLFRKIGFRSSIYSQESRIRRNGSYIYEEFKPTDGTDVKVYTVGPEYAHAEARKSPALDGVVERDENGKEVRYPVMLRSEEKIIAKKIVLAFKQSVCGFDLLRANGKSYVCDVNGFSFVKDSTKYYDDCASILTNMILREIAPQRHIPLPRFAVEPEDRPIVATTFGTMMELRCVVAVMRHGDRTPKQKMKMIVKSPLFFSLFETYGGMKDGKLKLKRPSQLQEVLDIARTLIQQCADLGVDKLPTKERKIKLQQLKAVLEMGGHFSGINRKVQMKHQAHGKLKCSSSEESDTDKGVKDDRPGLLLILKWGGELTDYGRSQAEDLGNAFRKMYPSNDGKSDTSFLRLHSTYRHDLKIYASDEGRVQMTAAAFAKGLLALDGELAPILVQMVKSANTNGLLDNDLMSARWQDEAKNKLSNYLAKDKSLSRDDMLAIDPTNNYSLQRSLETISNPVEMCRRVYSYIRELVALIRKKIANSKYFDIKLYHDESWELMLRRWSKLERDFYDVHKQKFDICKIPDIYDSIKYDLLHNKNILNFENDYNLYESSKQLADVIVNQEYGITQEEKLKIAQGIVTPLLRKIRNDLKSNLTGLWDFEETMVNQLDPSYTKGISSPSRHVRTRLYFTSESHVYSLLTVLKYGHLFDDDDDPQWKRALDYVSTWPELNYLTQIVIMLYEDPSVDADSDKRFHVELHFSPGSYADFDVNKNKPTDFFENLHSFGLKVTKFSSSTLSLNRKVSKKAKKKGRKNSSNTNDANTLSKSPRAYRVQTSQESLAGAESDSNLGDDDDDDDDDDYEEADFDYDNVNNDDNDDDNKDCAADEEEDDIAGEDAETTDNECFNDDDGPAAYTATIALSNEPTAKRIVRSRKGSEQSPATTRTSRGNSLSLSTNDHQRQADLFQNFQRELKQQLTSTSRARTYRRLIAPIGSGGGGLKDSPAVRCSRFSRARSSLPNLYPDLIKIRHIRPLETLHNNLSFRALHNFLTRMIKERVPVSDERNSNNSDAPTVFNRVSFRRRASKNFIKLHN